MLPTASAPMPTAMVVHAHALDASWRHGIHVGGDEQIARLLELIGGKQPLPGGTSRENHFGAAYKLGLLLLGRAVGITEFDLEARVGFLCELAHALRPAITDENRLGSLDGGDDR